MAFNNVRENSKNRNGSMLERSNREPSLNRVDTLAFYQRSGKEPDVRERLKIVVREDAIEGADNFRKYPLSPSKPTAFPVGR